MEGIEELPPLTVMVKPVSGHCNMRCSYCFYNDEMAHRDVTLFDKMNIETLENLVRRCYAYAEGQLTLIFQGGEPTLTGSEYFRSLLMMERKYNRHNLTVHHALQTNGLVLQDDLLAIFKEGNFLVGISIDGTREIHDSRRVDAQGKDTYSRAIHTAKRLKQNDIAYNILCVVDHQVALQPQEVFDSLSSHKYLQFIPCIDPLVGSERKLNLHAEEYGQFLVGLFKYYYNSWRNGYFVSIRTFDKQRLS